MIVNNYAECSVPMERIQNRYFKLHRYDSDGIFN